MAKTLPTGTVAADKWARNLAGATQSYKDGIDRVQISPMEQAAARQDAYVEGVRKAAESGKWAAGLRRITLSQWKEMAKKDGAANLAAGAAKGRAKWQRAYDEMRPYMEGVLAQLPARGDLNTNLARADAFARGMAEFKRQ